MIALLFTDGVLNWLQNILAFSVLSIVTPLTYAVASASKRIFVIAISLFILGNPVTWVNIFGMLVAIMGVLCYNRVRGSNDQFTMNSTYIDCFCFIDRQNTFPERRYRRKPSYRMPVPTTTSSTTRWRIRPCSMVVPMEKMASPALVAEYRMAERQVTSKMVASVTIVAVVVTQMATCY